MTRSHTKRVLQELVGSNAYELATLFIQYNSIATLGRLSRMNCTWRAVLHCKLTDVRLSDGLADRFVGRTTGRLAHKGAEGGTRFDRVRTITRMNHVCISPDMRILSQLLRKGYFASMTTLVLRNVFLSDTNAETILCVLPKTLHSIDLFDNCLSGRAMLALATYLVLLGDGRNLHALNVGKNPLGDAGACHLVPVWWKLKHIENLNLSFTGIGDQTLDRLVTSLGADRVPISLPRISVLALEGNAFGNGAMKTLANAMQEGGPLHFLHILALTTEAIDKEAVQEVVDALQGILEFDTLYVSEMTVPYLDDPYDVVRRVEMLQGRFVAPNCSAEALLHVSGV